MPQDRDSCGHSGGDPFDCANWAPNGGGNTLDTRGAVNGMIDLISTAADTLAHVMEKAVHICGLGPHGSHDGTNLAANIRDSMA